MVVETSPEPEDGEEVPAETPKEKACSDASATASGNFGLMMILTIVSIVFSLVGIAFNHIGVILLNFIIILVGGIMGILGSGAYVTHCFNGTIADDQGEFVTSAIEVEPE